MSIANELSNDVARAVLEQQAVKTEGETKGLTEIVLAVHSTLRLLTTEERRRRRAHLLLPPPLSNNAASGAH